jgi:DNA polymerase-4
MGQSLYEKSQGIHHGVVQPFHEAKSVSAENTFEENISDPEVLHSELVRLTEKVAFALRRDARFAGCIAVKIRYPDFETRTRQMSITPSCHDDDFIPAAVQLLQNLYVPGTPVRLLGVRLSDFSQPITQTSLFSDARRKTQLYQAIDEVKNKYGRSALQKARSLPKKSK